MIKKLYEKYKDVIPYLFFGVCTTAVNVISYWLCAHIFKLPVIVSTVIAWILAVLFAYVTNRKWVFKSTVNTTEGIIRELIAFFGCRIATGVIDWAGMWLLVEVIGFDDVVIKVLLNILVIVLNYVGNKLIIFKKQW